MRGSYLLHADEHTVVLIDKIEELSLYIQKNLRKLSKISYNCQSIIIYPLQ